MHLKLDLQWNNTLKILKKNLNYEEYKSNNLISEQLSFQIWTHRTLPVHNKSPTIAFSLMKYGKTLLTHAKLWHYHSFISNFTQFLWVSYLRSRIFIAFSLLFVGKVRHLKIFFQKLECRLLCILWNRRCWLFDCITLFANYHF